MQPRFDPEVRPVAEDPAEAMATYGIQRIPVDYFHWHGFRYSALNDAIAAAGRAQRVGLADG